MISTRTELWVVGAVLAAGFGWWAAQSVVFADPPPSALRLAGVIRCDTADKIPSDNGVRETVVCRTGKHKATVVTFDDNRDREDWVNGRHNGQVWAGLQGEYRTVIAGDRWAVETDDTAAMHNLVVQAHGWWV